MKVLAALVLLVVAIWAAGLLVFVGRVVASTPAASPPASDGIVALTGASSLRIEAAGDLLEQGLAQRLLISGVNPNATRDQVRQVDKIARKVFDCCVDLGFQAENTLGNARETADWARYHHYRTLIVVTADYHMPRALLELQAALPRVRLRPYPVATQTLDARRWWATSGSARRTVVEYSKYLAVLVRDEAQRLRRRFPHRARRPATGNAAA